MGSLGAACLGNFPEAGLRSLAPVADPTWRLARALLLRIRFLVGASAHSALDDLSILAAGGGAASKNLSSGEFAPKPSVGVDFRRARSRRQPDQVEQRPRPPPSGCEDLGTPIFVDGSGCPEIFSSRLAGS